MTEPRFVVTGIDPGPSMTAYALYDGTAVCGHGKVANADLREQIIQQGFFGSSAVVFEKVTSFGMPVGSEVFETVFWTGRFFEAIHGHVQEGAVVARLSRIDVKRHMCNDVRAKDANIRQAVIERFTAGGNPKEARGTKKAPGPLYGIKSDCWSALAVAITWFEQRTTSAKAAKGWESEF